MAELRRRHGDALDVTLIEGDRGIFDVALGGEILFSKYQRGRFPSGDEILREIDARRR